MVSGSRRAPSSSLIVVATLALALTGGQQCQAAVSIQNQVGQNSSHVSPPAQPVGQQQHQPGAPASSDSLQAQLNAIQHQAQRQLGQLNGLMLNAVNGTKYSNVLEAISNVGKAIQQQMSAAALNPAGGHLSIITAPASSQGQGELANNKKNEYQSIVVTDQGSSLVDGAGVPVPASNQSRPNGLAASDYREQGELIRQDIVRRVGQLQQVVAGSMDLLKNNGDLIVRRLLEQMNVRLDQAKAKADRIINEPATNEVALRALATINLGLNNLNNIIANIAARLDQANREGPGGKGLGQGQYQALGAAGSSLVSQRQQAGGVGQLAASLPQLLDSSKLRANLQQLGQQFQSALSGGQLQQQLAALRQRQLQQLALLQPGARQQVGAGGAPGAQDTRAQQPQPQPQQPITAGNRINEDFGKRQ